MTTTRTTDTDELAPCPKCDCETREIKIWQGFRNNYFGLACTNDDCGWETDPENAVLDNDRF